MILYKDNENTVRCNDIVLADSNRLAIVNRVDEEEKIIDITFIDNAFRCFIKIGDCKFVTHNNEASAKSYKDLLLKSKSKRK